MLILHITYKIKVGQRDRFMSEIKLLGIPKASKGEKGCLAYDYYHPESGEDEIFLKDIWEDEDCLTAHTQTAHFARLKDLKDQYVSTVRIDKYYVSKV